MKTVLTVILLIVIFTDCSNGDNSGRISHEKSKELNIELTKETVYMSDIFKDIRYLKLEEVEGHLIGRIRKIVIRDEILFLFDKTTPSIFLYDLSGNYLNQIVIKVGRGPEEMLTAVDFTVNVKEQKVFVLGFQEIHTYAYNGKFLDRQSLAINPTKFALLPDNNFALFMNSRTYSSGNIKNMGYNLLYLGQESVTQKFLEIEKYKANLSMRVPNNFPKYNGKLLFYFYPSYNIYELTPDGISVRYTIDFGENITPLSLYKERKNLNQGTRFLSKTIEAGNASFLARFLETDSLIFFSVFWDRIRSYPIFYSKKTGQLWVAEKLVNDIDGGLSPYFTATYSNELVAFIQPVDLLNEVQKLKKEATSLNEHQQELLDFSKGLDPLDNPVIMFVKVRSNLKF